LLRALLEEAERSPEHRAALAESDALVAELKATDVLIIGVPVYVQVVAADRGMARGKSSAFETALDQIERLFAPGAAVPAAV